jgi:AraC-like DNA-binding protein/quercetin dioxygenase-like cupin family protein
MRRSIWPEDSPVAPESSCTDAHWLRMYAPGAQPRAGALFSPDLDVDSHWHRHDMHQMMFAFEGAVELESDRGRHLIPRHLAAWIPTGVAHRTSIHHVRVGSVFFPADMVEAPGLRIRTLIVSPLMREMMREAMRWQLDGPDTPLRTNFFEALAGFCGEWIEREADLFLPAVTDLRLERALDYTAREVDAKLPDVCRNAGVSERTLRRRLKAETGLSWEDYRRRSRLLQAVSLLSETDASVGDIAARCGFESPSGFAKAFRVAVGEAPSAYRNRIKDTVDLR